jgi:hypothetical protein
MIEPATIPANTGMSHAIAVLERVLAAQWPTMAAVA